MKLLTKHVTFLLSVPVFTLESSLSNPRSEKLTSNHTPEYGEQGGDNFQTLIHNNSQETKSLRGQLGALQRQVCCLYVTHCIEKHDEHNTY